MSIGVYKAYRFYNSTISIYDKMVNRLYFEGVVDCILDRTEYSVVSSTLIAMRCNEVLNSASK